MAKQETAQATELPSLPRAFTRSDKAFIEALKKMLDVKPFTEIRVVDLAREAGFSKGAFYRQHEDKHYFVRDIVRNLAQSHGYYLRIHSDLLMRSFALNSAEIRNSTKASVDYIYENRQLYSMVIDNKLPGAGVDFFVSTAMEYGFGGWQCFTSDAFVTYVTISTCLTYVNFWKLNEFVISPEEMTQLTLDYEGMAYQGLSTTGSY